MYSTRKLHIIDLNKYLFNPPPGLPRYGRLWFFLLVEASQRSRSRAFSLLIETQATESSFQGPEGLPPAPARPGSCPPLLVKNDAIKKTTTNTANATEKSQKGSQKSNLFIVLLTRILKCENVFGLHRRERIEVQAILKTAKQQPQHDMQTNAHTHLRFDGKETEELSKRFPEK